MDKSEIGAKLRSFRESKNMRAKDVSDLLASKFQITLNYKTIYDYENGRTSPNPDVLLALCDLYGRKDLLSEFGYAVAVGHLDDDCEQYVLFEDEYTPENWTMIKNFLALVPLKDPKK